MLHLTTGDQFIDTCTCMNSSPREAIKQTFNDQRWPKNSLNSLAFNNWGTSQAQDETISIRLNYKLSPNISVILNGVKENHKIWRGHSKITQLRNWFKLAQQISTGFNENVKSIHDNTTKVHLTLKKCLVSLISVDSINMWTNLVLFNISLSYHL